MPNTRLSTFWNITMMLLMFYTATYIPYKTAFIDSSADYVNNIELSIDCLFILDILFNFLTAYEDNDRTTEFRLGMIACNYLKSWFFLDAFSSVPF